MRNHINFCVCSLFHDPHIIQSSHTITQQLSQYAGGNLAIRISYILQIYNNNKERKKEREAASKSRQIFVVVLLRMLHSSSSMPYYY